MNMQFYTVNSAQPAAEYIARLVTGELLNEKKVLWLLSGGSAIAVAVMARTLIASTNGLTVGLIDERHGEPGHADSNWRQLEESGFDFTGLHTIPVLHGKSITEETALFERVLESATGSNTSIIGLLGIGDDGHTAGILPGSPAVKNTALVCGYDGGKFQRITITGRAISMLQEAAVYAVGEAKWPQLKRLTDTIDIAEQPAQALKQAKKLTIFTDMKEGDI